MVNIKLDSKFSLTSDSRQWILNIDNRAWSYHTRLEDALKCYLERKMKDSDAKTINTLLLRQKQLCAALNQALTPLEIRIESKKEEIKCKK